MTHALHTAFYTCYRFCLAIHTHFLAARLRRTSHFGFSLCTRCTTCICRTRTPLSLLYISHTCTSTATWTHARVLHARSPLSCTPGGRDSLPVCSLCAFLRPFSYATRLIFFTAWQDYALHCVRAALLPHHLSFSSLSSLFCLYFSLNLSYHGATLSLSNTLSLSLTFSNTPSHCWDTALRHSEVRALARHSPSLALSVAALTGTSMDRPLCTLHCWTAAFLLLHLSLLHRCAHRVFYLSGNLHFHFLAARLSASR